TAKYQIDASMQIMGTDAKFNATVNEKVTKVDANGDVVIEQTSNGKVTFGGQEMEIPQEVGSMKYKATGEILEINSPEADESTNRREFLNTIIVPDGPVKTGDKWSREVKAAPINGNTSGKGEYECLGAQKVGDADAVAIKFTYTETSG